MWKKLRSFIGTDMKWTSTYIKRINCTKIYARAHYHQRTEKFPKLTKGRITLFEAAGSQTSRRPNFSNNLKEPRVSRASHLPHRRAEPGWCQPPALGSRSTSLSGNAPRSGSCCSTGARPPPHTSPASLGAGLMIPERKNTSV